MVSTQTALHSVHISIAVLSLLCPDSGHYMRSRTATNRPIGHRDFPQHTRTTTMTDETLATAGHKPSFFASLLGALRTWRKTNATRTALSALTDRELDDIGMTRGDIESIARSR